MIIYPSVFALTVPLLLNFGPITWMVTALVERSFLGMTLGRARRAARQGADVLPDSATGPLGVTGTAVATWAIGKDWFEELNPTGEKLDELLVHLNGRFSGLVLRAPIFGALRTARTLVNRSAKVHRECVSDGDRGAED